MAKAKTAITPTRAENYPEWYQQVIKAADLAEHSAVRGCMVIKPWGFGIWETIKGILDKKFKDTGHENAYFPLFIPLSYLQKEAKHVDGFAKECAVVTHHRLEADADGQLVPGGKLEEPLVVRPTSEMIIGASYAKWVKSYRDLPILINQWANVVRWEMRTRLFLRTAEFLWQEGHTVHATAEEAVAETEQMLEVYRDVAENYLALPVIPGQKTPDERFAGADDTLTIEAMMQDGKALQAGTSHFLGQNFSKAMDITFTDKDETQKHPYTTSWGVSTRLMGGLIMTHSDDDGLIIPPKVAHKHVVILPVYRNDEDRDRVLAACKELKTSLTKLPYGLGEVGVIIDDRDIRGGEKTWEHIKKGVPVRIEIGPRDLDKGQVVMARRDKAPKDKEFLPVAEVVGNMVATLDAIQDGLWQKALAFRNENTVTVDSKEALEEFFGGKDGQSGGFAMVHVDPNDDTLAALKALKLSIRCLPRDGDKEPGACVYTQKPCAQRAVVARSY